MYRARYAVVMAVVFMATGCDESKNSREEASESPVAKAPDTKGAPSGSSDFFLARVEHEVVANTPTQLAFEVKPGAGLKINPDYPWRATIEVDGAQGVEVTSPTIAKGDIAFGSKAASLPFEVTATSPGVHRLEGTVNLSVCEEGDNARCLWFNDEPVTIEVTAVEKPATP